MNRKRKTNEIANTKNKKRKGGAKSNADDIIRNVEQWVVAAMDREMFNEKRFLFEKIWRMTVSLICGASKSTVLRVRKGNSENNGNKPGRREIKLDDFDKRALSQACARFVLEWTPPEIPTVTRIYE